MRVYDVDTGELRAVASRCSVCKVTTDDVRMACFVLSPSGKAHHVSFERDTDTACGKDATREGWWWRA